MKMKGIRVEWRGWRNRVFRINSRSRIWRKIRSC